MPHESTIVKLEDVGVQFSGVPILEEVNLSIKQHDFLGIIGPNGGGKTTLLKVVLGLVKPNSGNVTVFGDTPE
ncbi:MAG: ATP-binding cassette domain-containing protein, partial [Methanosarcinales archaeon]